jgi:hypothetical protein
MSRAIIASALFGFGLTIVVFPGPAWGCNGLSAYWATLADHPKPAPSRRHAYGCSWQTQSDWRSVCYTR